MCKPASFVLTKNTVEFSSTSNSHAEIIRERGLAPGNNVTGIRTLSVELVPADNDYTTPVAAWVFGYDQDILPDWADRERDEARTRLAMTDWLESHCCHQTGQHLVGGFRVVQDSSDNSTQTAGNHSMQTAGCGNLWAKPKGDTP